MSFDTGIRMRAEGGHNKATKWPRPHGTMLCSSEAGEVIQRYDRRTNPLRRETAISFFTTSDRQHGRP